ncbi:IPT/TIG domain-containing protein [Flagellimonas sp.]|uniref:IPT/TIG domain-containing protein n=1 Tax=Flagellimonas sp. TaxID=2058762 RepID=UPI003B522820
MKKIPYFVSMLLLIGIIVVACKKDDDSTPPGANHTVTGFTPASGSVGTLVTVNGTNFTNQNISVNFNGVDATVSSVNISGKSLMVFVPEDAETGKISVTIDDVEVKSAANFTVTDEVSGPESIELADNYLEMYTLDTAKFPEITNWDEFPDGSSIQIESNNPDIVDINEDGDLVALQSGVADITITIGELTATVDVDVNPSIIVAGYDTDDQDNSFATLWINGIPTRLTDGNSAAAADAVVLEGQKIYAAGTDHNGTTYVAYTWEVDGTTKIATELTEGIYSARARGIAIKDDIVYAVGYESNGDTTKAYQWENINSVELSPTTSVAKAITLNGDDVLVGGYYFKNGKDIAVVWENKLPTDLTLGEFDASANSVYAYNNYSFAAGYEKNENNKRVAKVWVKDVSVHELTDGTNSAVAYSVTANGSQVCAVGNETINGVNVAKFWIIKDGIITSKDITNGEMDAGADSIFELNGVYYVAGYENDGGKDIAVYWIVDQNGVVIDKEELSSYYSYTHSIIAR